MESLPSEQLLQWVRDLGFATGHADTEAELLQEVGRQIQDLRDTISTLLAEVSN